MGNPCPEQTLSLGLRPGKTDAKALYGTGQMNGAGTGCCHCFQIRTCRKRQAHCHTDSVHQLTGMQILRSSHPLNLKSEWDVYHIQHFCGTAGQVEGKEAIGIRPLCGRKTGHNMIFLMAGLIKRSMGQIGNCMAEMMPNQKDRHIGAFGSSGPGTCTDSCNLSVRQGLPQTGRYFRDILYMLEQSLGLL